MLSDNAFCMSAQQQWFLTHPRSGDEPFPTAYRATSRGFWQVKTNGTTHYLSSKAQIRCFTIAVPMKIQNAFKKNYREAHPRSGCLLKSHHALKESVSSTQEKGWTKNSIRYCIILTLLHICMELSVISVLKEFQHRRKTVFFPETAAYA